MNGQLNTLNQTLLTRMLPNNWNIKNTKIYRYFLCFIKLKKIIIIITKIVYSSIKNVSCLFLDLFFNLFKFCYSFKRKPNNKYKLKTNISSYNTYFILVYCVLSCSIMSLIIISYLFIVLKFENYWLEGTPKIINLIFQIQS